MKPNFLSSYSCYWHQNKSISCVFPWKKIFLEIWLKSLPLPPLNRFRSIRESGAGEHSDFWVFQKFGDAFHAYKISEWYKFLPSITHATLDADQAEERFMQRNKVMNQFALSMF